jgi:large subunit ribosomal protein L10
MSKVRPDKVAAVGDVTDRVADTATAVVTEYRGLTVSEISTLRRELRKADAEYKVAKNTLVRRAIAGTSVESLSPYLEGPTAIAWVKGDVSAVAKILRDFARTTPSLVLKGGVMDGRALSAKELASLADLPSRDVMLSQLAGLIAAPMRQMAGLMKAVPQSFAYGLKALVEQKSEAA